MNINHLIKEGTFPRPYRKNTTKASINPAIAYAMNQIGGIDKGDRVLDPCCGTGTLLVERQLIAPALCIGVDIDPRTLDAAKENIKLAFSSFPDFPPLPNPPPPAGREHFKSEIHGLYLFHGDIMEKKFPEGYFTKIISNLPYGVHSGSREKNVKLYHFLADISSTWLKKGGKAILLTSAKNLLRNSFEFNQKMKLIEENEIPNDSLKRAIFIFEKI